MKTARRLLAGLAAAGAFVAATALPAYAAPSFQVESRDTLVAPDSSTIEYTFIWTEDDLSGKTISMEIDTSKLEGAYIGYSMGSDIWDCDEEGAPLVRCVQTAPEGSFNAVFDYQLFGNSDAKVGTVGAITFTVDIDGVKESAAKKVTIAEASDLASPQTVPTTGDPGGIAKATLPVSNVGQSTVERYVLNISADYRSPYVGDFSNCTDYSYFVVCEFDQPLEPGGNYQLSEGVPFKLDTIARTGGVLSSPGMWLTQDDWDVIKDSWITEDVEAKPGKGEPLRLEEVANARRVPQTDTNTSNDYFNIDIKVGGNNYADMAAVGVNATAAAGASRTISPSITNLGPAQSGELAEERDAPLVRITLPDGITVTEAPYFCAPYKDGGAWPPAEDAMGRAGATAYGCLVFDMDPTWTMPHDFIVKVDRVVPNATGTITVKVDHDPNASNDTARIVLNATGGGAGGGEDGGSLPVTGPQATLIVGVGVLLVAAGAAGFVVARRRRTRFVA